VKLRDNPALKRKRSGRLKLLIGLALVLLVVFPVLLEPIFSSHDPLKVDLAARLLPPGSTDHILGTDQVGRDLFSRMALGGRVSLTTGFLAILAAAVIGGGLGLLSGYLGGSIDMVVTRLLEMQQERQRRAGEQGEGEDQGKTGDILELLDAKDVVQGGEYEGTRHQTGHEGIHDDLDRPVDVFVGVDEKIFQGPGLTVNHGSILL